VDRIILRQETIRSKYDLVKTLREGHYDLFISLPRSQEALMLAGLSGAGIKAGFAHFPWDIALDVKEVIQGHNSWHNNANLLRKLGIPVTQDNYLGLLHVEDHEPVNGLPERYIVISPGASRRRLVKAWDEEKFAELIVKIHDRFGLPSVLVGGQDTKECTAVITAQMNDSRKGNDGQVMDLAAKIGLRELYGVLKGADLFVGIDSGVMHMASAMNIPVVALFGPTDEFYVGPQNEKSIVVRQSPECAPCYLREPCEYRKCMAELDIETVFEACEKILGLRR
jgi:heptosyltransferase-2